MSEEKITKEEYKQEVFTILLKWSDDDMWYTYKTLQDSMDEEGLNISINSLKVIMKDFIDSNIVKYGPTININGQINGKGYFLTREAILRRTLK